MGDALAKILRYVVLWLVIFLGLCVVSVIRYWSVFAADMADAAMSTIRMWFNFLVIMGILIAAIVMLFRAGG